MSLDMVRKTFTKWAPVYNATHAWSLPGRRAARLALGAHSGDRVLDVACGTGLNLPHLRELVGERGSVVGADLTPAMLEIARRIIAAQGWQNVEVQVADASQLPFPEESFDKAICTFALNIIPDYVRAIAEIWRVLVPGGRFVALEMRSGLRQLPGWLQPLPQICAVAVSHQTLEGLSHAFDEMEVRYFWKGMIFMAMANKTGA